MGLSHASIEINFGFEILILGGRALPSIILTPLRNPKFQNTPIPILSADLESAEKTVNCKRFSFFVPIRRLSKVLSNIVKHTFPFNFFVNC